MHLNAISLKHLRAFVAVAKHGSFRMAARDLSRAQPSVTLAIQQLEEAVGMVLLVRTTRKVNLTQEGEKFYKVAKRLIADFDEAMLNIETTALRQKGFVAISVIPSIASYLMPDVVKAFRVQYPGISLTVRDDMAADVEQKVLHNEVDFGIGSTTQKHADLLYRPLLEDRYDLLCHKEHPLASQLGPITWPALRGYQFFDSGIQNIIPARGLINNQLYSFPTTAMLFAMVREGIGVTAIPTLSKPIDSTEFVTRPLELPVVKRKVYMISRKEWVLTPASSAMIDILLATIPKTLKSFNMEHVESKIKHSNFPTL